MLVKKLNITDFSFFHKTCVELSTCKEHYSSLQTITHIGNHPLQCKQPPHFLPHKHNIQTEACNHFYNTTSCPNKPFSIPKEYNQCSIHIDVNYAITNRGQLIQSFAIQIFADTE